MKWAAFGAEVIGLLASLLLTWGYAPPKGTTTWISNDPEGFNRDSKRRALGAKLGFAALAVSFLIQAAVTLMSN
ncbi:MAG: hypothetical protein ACREFP_22800 [Acetobacteraceae bacterium]